MADPAGHAVVQQSLQVPHGEAEAVLGDDGKLLSAFIPGLQHGVAFLQGGGHGFFAYYVLPAAQGVDADFHMGKRRGAHVHQVDIQAQNIMVILEDFRVQTVLFLDTLGFSGDNVHKRDDFAPFRKLKIGFDMRVGDAAGSDDGNPDHISFPFAVRKLLIYNAFTLYEQYNRKHPGETT